MEIRHRVAVDELHRGALVEEIDHARAVGEKRLHAVGVVPLAEFVAQVLARHGN